MSLKVLLSIEQQSYRELLEHMLLRHSNVELVCQSCNFVECLALISQYQPHIWIHSACDGCDLQVAVERAYELSPQLAIVRVNADEPAGYLQVRVESVSEVFAIFERMSCAPEFAS